jgi:hypothetical protein
VDVKDIDGVVKEGVLACIAVGGEVEYGYEGVEGVWKSGVGRGVTSCSSSRNGENSG